LTLAVNNEGQGALASTMTIDVYDDACELAKLVDPMGLLPTDFDSNCITDISDLSEVIAEWLSDYSETEPFVKP